MRSLVRSPSIGQGRNARITAGAPRLGGRVRQRMPRRRRSYRAGPRTSLTGLRTDQATCRTWVRALPATRPSAGPGAARIEAQSRPPGDEPRGRRSVRPQGSCRSSAGYRPSQRRPPRRRNCLGISVAGLMVNPRSVWLPIFRAGSTLPGASARRRLGYSALTRSLHPPGCENLPGCRGPKPLRLRG